MPKIYKWRANSTILPATTLSHGVIPSTYETWQDATVGEQTERTWQYFYRDSNTSQSGQFLDSISTRVITTIKQSWTATIDSRNVLTIQVTTTIGPIDRDDKRGNDQNLPARQISIQSSQTGEILHFRDDKVAENHSIYSGVTTINQTIVLQPGSNQTGSTVYIYNQTEGSSSYDDISAGVQFMNPLPADYRPGSTIKTDNPYYPGDQTGIWLSHNRNDGAAHVLADIENITWQEMRTINGDSGGQGNPPLILHQADANSWYNQKLLGKD